MKSSVYFSISHPPHYVQDLITHTTPSLYGINFSLFSNVYMIPDSLHHMSCWHTHVVFLLFFFLFFFCHRCHVTSDDYEEKSRFELCALHGWHRRERA
jgi:hypothetical protein